MTDDAEFPKAWLKPIYDLRQLNTGAVTAEFVTVCDLPKIEDWFKQCIEDSPQIEYKVDDEHEVYVHNYPAHNQWLEWKKKWFGQFKEKSKHPEPISVEEF